MEDRKLQTGPLKFFCLRQKMSAFLLLIVLSLKMLMLLPGSNPQDERA
ncbi:MAG: hypothetical protein ABSA44_11795 [Bacteroidota bacterium]|jgi:hypothetical protein